MDPSLGVAKTALLPARPSGACACYDYMINVDGTNRHELSLSADGAQYGLIIPATTGGGPPPFVNVMRVPVPSLHSLNYRAAKQRLQNAHLRVGKSVAAIRPAPRETTSFASTPTGEPTRTAPPDEDRV